MECFVMWSGESEKILNDKIWHWVLIDTMIRLCFKHAVSKVARVLCIWTLKPEQENAIDHVWPVGEFDHSFCRWFWL